MTDEEYLAHIESAILEIKAHTAGMSSLALMAKPVLVVVLPTKAPTPTAARAPRSV